MSFKFLVMVRHVVWNTKLISIYLYIYISIGGDVYQYIKQPHLIVFKGDQQNPSKSRDWWPGQKVCEWVGQMVQKIRLPSMALDIYTVYIWGFPKMWVLQIIHFNRVFHCKPSVLGILHFRKYVYQCRNIACGCKTFGPARLSNRLSHTDHTETAIGPAPTATQLLFHPI